MPQQITAATWMQPIWLPPIMCGDTTISPQNLVLQRWRDALSVPNFSIFFEIFSLRYIYTFSLNSQFSPSTHTEARDQNCFFFTPKPTSWRKNGIRNSIYIYLLFFTISFFIFYSPNKRIGQPRGVAELKNHAEEGFCRKSTVNSS